VKRQPHTDQSCRRRHPLRRVIKIEPADVLGLAGAPSLSSERGHALARWIHEDQTTQWETAWLPLIIEELTLLLPEGHASRLIRVLWSVRDRYRAAAGIAPGVRDHRRSVAHWAALSRAMILRAGESGGVKLRDVAEHRQQRARLREYISRHGAAIGLRMHGDTIVLISVQEELA
jgi:hypothetical protein